MDMELQRRDQNKRRRGASDGILPPRLYVACVVMSIFIITRNEYGNISQICSPLRSQLRICLRIQSQPENRRRAMIDLFLSLASEMAPLSSVVFHFYAFVTNHRLSFPFHSHQFISYTKAASYNLYKSADWAQSLHYEQAKGCRTQHPSVRVSQAGLCP